MMDSFQVPTSMQRELFFLGAYITTMQLTQQKFSWSVMPVVANVASSL